MIIPQETYLLYCGWTFGLLTFCKSLLVHMCKCQRVSPGDDEILNSHQQWAESSIIPHSPQPLGLAGFLIFATLVGVKSMLLYFKFAFPWLVMVEDSFIYIWKICASFSVGFYEFNFAKFGRRLFVFSLLIPKSFCILDTKSF